jgi:ATP-dependent helicase YprA (DUF1998 family)
VAINPIQFTELVVDDFLHYQLTTYPLADTSLYQQLRDLLQLDTSRSTPLRKGPFISLSRPFKQGASVANLIADGVFHPAMQGLVPYPHVRAHQEAAIRAIHEGDTTLVSTGTGSGKTESFLYPIISRCLELKDAGAPPGVVAVLIYPMNALAEDQLDRLRGLLAGSGIPFGMYVGKTPEEEAEVRAERMPAGTTKAAYRERLDQIREAGQGTTLLPPEECASRKTMRSEEGRPRILLTNVKQLELLLTRGKDVGIFASAPLEFLVFDEAHTFRGAQGAETAVLTRRLRTFCGKAAKDVRHIATSATMADPNGDDQAAKDFARRFFGVDGSRVTLVRETYDDLRWNPKRTVPPAPNGDPVAILNALLKAVDADDAAVVPAISKELEKLGGRPLPKASWQEALTNQLAANEIVYQLAEALAKPRAMADLPKLLADVAGRQVTEEEILSWLALGAATGRGGNDPLLRPVVHTFVRGVGGAVVTLSDPGSAARLWLSGEDAEAELHDAFRRFPIVTCTTCGQHYYENFVKDFALLAGARTGPTGGDLVGEIRVWEHLPEEGGGSRALMIDRLVVRPDEDDDGDDDEDDGDGGGGDGGDGEGAHDIEHRRLCPMFVCSKCGSLQQDRSSRCPVCAVQNAQVPVQVVRCKEEYPGRLHSCVACAAPGRRPGGGRYREPARPVRAVGVSDVHVLAQSMVHLSERPRLLVFADNRQDAAFQAGWMRDHARRFRLRALMSQFITDTGAAVGDVVHGLSEMLERDQDLSRALIPEVWQVVPFDESGVKHREERVYFLRLQVLREAATGVKQRLGLEPWGRLKVDYKGLSPEIPFVARWAPMLGVETAALSEGVAALLDHLRRIRILHDQTKLFEKKWQSGDKEIQYGYVPKFSGGPRGAKLTRGGGDEAARVSQWIGTRPTQVWNVAASWGVPEEELERFLTELWDELRRLKILVPATLESRGRPLPGAAGAHQIDSSRMSLHRHSGRYRCERCRRTTVRQGPTALCMAWRCAGRLVWEAEAEDDFDLRVLDGNYSMLRVAEHSAQVPHAVRERMENQFKGAGEQLNTLVCTPTLELGVDIGALDAVLMRNVPPTAANYWQRAGRAGRRHRMAVDVTYAQAAGFDQAYYRDPLRLLGGQVEPPRFNLRNEVMISKHVHAAVMTALHEVARKSPDDKRRDIEAELARCFPPTLGSYLFTPGGEVREHVLDVSPLGALIRADRPAVVAAVTRAFAQSWPAEDAAAVDSAKLESLIDEMATALQAILGRFKRRLDWAREQLAILHTKQQRQGDLDPEDSAHERRCKKIISRLKGTQPRSRSQAQGGPDDSDTFGALAREGFLPGYGLESGSIIGSAEPPRMTQGLDDFDLPRPPTMALREYVPGNAIYANGFRFVPRRFHLTAEDTIRFRVVADQQVVQDLGVDCAQQPLGTLELRAVPVCDVSMPSASQISDEEEFRFQMSVATYGQERGFHRGGQAWTWGGLDVRFRRGVELRLVNVGPRKEVEQQRLGFPLCLACGQSLSPFSSRAAREEFEKLHLEKCRHVVQPTGFYAGVEVDVLGLHDIEDRRVGFSVMEALRMGAARVLDMEIEDLQLLAIGKSGEDRCDILLYDPMPGGSGLLEHLTERLGEVRDAALELLRDCPSACERSCIDCLQTYRNRFYHEFLDRHAAIAVLQAAAGPLVSTHPIPENLPTTSTTSGQPQTPIETPFKRLIAAAGLPAPKCQHPLDLGAGYGGTVPDFFYDGTDDDEPGLCVYVDGMSGHIHGNPEQKQKDDAIRAKLSAMHYEVVVVRSFELNDRDAMVRTISRIAKYLVGKEKQRSLKEDTTWFDRAAAPVDQPAGGALEASEEEPRPFRIVQPQPKDCYRKCIPLVPLVAAAGFFSDSQPASDGDIEWLWEGDWVEINGRTKPSEGLFVAQVVGESMNRRIPNGAWCVWKSNPTGTRQNAVVIAELPEIDDAGLVGRYTVKVYASEKVADDEGGWRHSRVILKPDSNDPSFKPIVLEDLNDGDLRIVAELVEVLR